MCCWSMGGKIKYNPRCPFKKFKKLFQICTAPDTTAIIKVKKKLNACTHLILAYFGSKSLTYLNLARITLTVEYTLSICALHDRFWSTFTPNNFSTFTF